MFKLRLFYRGFPLSLQKQRPDFALLCKYNQQAISITTSLGVVLFVCFLFNFLTTYAILRRPDCSHLNSLADVFDLSLPYLVYTTINLIVLNFALFNFPQKQFFLVVTKRHLLRVMGLMVSLIRAMLLGVGC